jgi:hypothetical protein
MLWENFLLGNKVNSFLFTFLWSELITTLCFEIIELAGNKHFKTDVVFAYLVTL